MRYLKRFGLAEHAGKYPIQTSGGWRARTRRRRAGVRVRCDGDDLHAWPRLGGPHQRSMCSGARRKCGRDAAAVRPRAFTSSIQARYSSAASILVGSPGNVEGSQPISPRPAGSRPCPSAFRAGRSPPTAREAGVRLSTHLRAGQRDLPRVASQRCPDPSRCAVNASWIELMSRYEGMAGTDVRRDGLPEPDTQGRCERVSDAFAAAARADRKTQTPRPSPTHLSLLCRTGRSSPASLG
jgi:hypothetical protein